MANIEDVDFERAKKALQAQKGVFTRQINSFKTRAAAFKKSPEVPQKFKDLEECGHLPIATKKRCVNSFCDKKVRKQFLRQKSV